MTALSYHHTVNDLQGIDFVQHGPFGRREWFALLEADGAHPHIALARDKDQALALVLAGERGSLQGLTNWYAFTWAILTTQGADDRLLESLARGLPRAARHIALSKLADEDGTASRIERAFVRAGWFVSREPCDTNHILAVNGRSFAAYLAGRPGALKTTLKRKAGKVQIDVYTVFQDDAWRSYEEVYAGSWKPEEGAGALLRRFAETEGAAGRLRMGLARAEGRVVAAQFWTVEGGAAYIHKLAHLESAKRISPGTSLTAAMLSHVIDRDGVQLVDFGTGDQPYKRDWMEQTRPRFRLDCRWPADPRNWPAIAFSVARTLVSRPSQS